MSTSKSGKHGMSKVHIVGIDLFTGDQLEDIVPSAFNVDVPHVTRKDYTLVEFEGENVSCLNDDGEKVDFKMDAVVDANQESLKERIANGESLKVTVLEACGESVAVGTKQNDE